MLRRSHSGADVPRFFNLPAGRAHLLVRLDRVVSSTAAPALIELRAELAAYPCPPPASRPDVRAILVPMRLRVQDATLSLFSTTTVFGTPRDVKIGRAHV